LTAYDVVIAGRGHPLRAHQYNQLLVEISKIQQNSLCLRCVCKATAARIFEIGCLPGLGTPPMRKGYLPHWVRELLRRRYLILGVIWAVAVALCIAVWIYVALQTDG
jgi:hypothetical protein